jgi:hypothetical protein
MISYNLPRNSNEFWSLLQEQMDTEKKQKRNDALGLIIESVLQPDHKLRQCAHNQKCYNELMEVREEVLEYLNQRRKEEFDV